jgi:integrase/recombinase XerD
MNKKLHWKISKSLISKKEIPNTQDQIKIKIESLMNLMEDFLLQADIQENSKKTYFKGLKKFIQWTMVNNTDEVLLSKNLLTSYKNNLMQSNIKPHTQAVYLVALKQFFVWSESNLIFPNIAKNIKGIKKITKQHHKDPLKKEDIVKLLTIEEQEKNNIIESRNNALLHLLIFTGIRIGETTHIQMEDIEYNNNEKVIIWIKGKGRSGKDNFIILLKNSIDIIQEYINLRKSKGEDINAKSYLFVSHGNRKNKSGKMSIDSISRIVKEKMKKVKIKTKRISAHSLRHTYGVLAIKSGVSLHELQISMRHSTPSTTQVYLGDIEKEKRKEANTEKTIVNFFKNNDSNNN